MTVQLNRLDRGNLKALADVSIPSEFGEINLRGFRVIHKEGQDPWVGFPSSSYIKNGKTMNYPVLRLPASLERQIADLVLAEYEASKK